MSRAAIVQAERVRRRNLPVSPAQRRYLDWLAEQAGIEPPEVRWSSEASKAITALKRYIHVPSQLALELVIGEGPR